MYLSRGSATMDVITGLISVIALDPGNVEDLVGERSNDFVGGGDICVRWQLLEDLGDVKPWVAMDQVEQRSVEHAVGELPGLVGEGGVPVVMICL